jgi:hypothetical protein
MTTPRIFCCATMLALAALSCTQPVMVTLAPGPARPLADRSVNSPTPRSVHTVMVLPPEGTSRDPQKVPEFSALERELLRRGIRVISAGLTGRVAIESKVSSESGSAATNLSQLERALVLAKKSNADALLQVESLGWEPQSRGFVYTVPPSGPPPAFFREAASPEEWSATPFTQRYAIQGPTMHFVGKLIDVESGEVNVVIDLTQPTYDLLPPGFAMTFKWTQGKGFDPAEYGSGSISTDQPMMRQQAQDNLMSALAGRIAGGAAQPRPTVFLPNPMQPPVAPPPTPGAVASPGR